MIASAVRDSLFSNSQQNSVDPSPEMGLGMLPIAPIALQRVDLNMRITVYFFAPRLKCTC